MNKYTETIYPDVETDYPQKLCNYLEKRFYKNSLNLLDVGCGKGTHMACFEKIWLKCSGIDISIEQKEWDIKQCNAEKERFPFDDDFFDCIFSKSFIEHIINPENFLKESYRVLKKKGIIVIMTPDWHSQMNGAIWDDYTHFHPYTLKSLKDALLIHGFLNVGYELFYQLPFIWKHPRLKFIPKIISIVPDSWKWKTPEMRNGEDRKLIRFSKEKMLLCWGYK